MSLDTELDLLLRARVTLIVLITAEEERAVQAIKQVCESTKRACLSWDVADHFRVVCNHTGSVPSAKEAAQALEQIDKADDKEKTVFILKDFHESWANAPIKRKLRNVVQRLKETKKSILVTTPGNKIPDELKDEAVVLDFAPPTAKELDDILGGLLEIPGVKNKLTRLGREKLVQAALGLSWAQSYRVFSKAIVRDRVLDSRDISLATEEKKQIIRESKALDFYPATTSPEDVGGLEVLKEWLKLRERAFTQEARDYGLPAPKGIALIGIPGTGKSLAAKMIASLWRLPLLRFDVGALYGSLLGESEERTRKALQLADTVAPCVVWLDEMEKALSHSDLDSGTSTRVFGNILTWMQEKTSSCFVVATANDVKRLPPELLRKGRFDEIFFLDLPGRRERQEIFAVHLRLRRRNPADFDLARLAGESRGYVGAEIEQAIFDAMYTGFNASREFTTEDISASIRRQVPLSVSQRETIESLRSWLREGRAQSASLPDPGDTAEPLRGDVMNESSREVGGGTPRSGQPGAPG